MITRAALVAVKAESIWDIQGKMTYGNNIGLTWNVEQVVGVLRDDGKLSLLLF